MAADPHSSPNSTRGKPEHDGVPTTGHSWDGIEELDNPMPRWWLWTFYISIAWSVLWMVLYPAWPLVRGATSGLLGYSSRGEVAAEIADFNTRNAPLFARLEATPLEELHSDDELQRFAANAGAAVFRAQCSQCHGDGAAGVQAGGFPNLLDDDWIWGGRIDDILTTVTHGIRSEEFDDTRWSEMPAFGRDGMLDAGQIDAVVEFVRQISHQEYDAVLATAGAEVFAMNCTSCHGSEGQGDLEQGAPRLNDAIWLYGGSRERIRESVFNARFGVMPGFANRLRPAEIRAVAAYVHQLGGGL